MDTVKVLAWLRQQTTVAAISTAAGTLVAVAGGQLSWSAAAPVLVGALVGALLPDNSAAKAGATTLTADVVQVAEAVIVAGRKTQDFREKP